MPSHHALARWYRSVGQNLNAGVPLIEAMQSSPGARASEVALLAAGISSGKSMRDALAEATWLPQKDRFLLEAGHLSGRLPAVCDILEASHKTAHGNLVRMVVTAIYPTLIFIVATFVVSLLKLFAFGDDGSMTLRWGAYLGAVIPQLIIYFGILGAVLWLSIINSPIIRAIQSFIPGMRGYAKDRAMADLCFALESFVVAAVPPDKAWRMAGQISGSKAIREASFAIADVAASGHRPGLKISEFSVFPREFAGLYKSGEDTGQLDRNLDTLARDFDQAAKNKLNVITIVYPLLILLATFILAAIQIVIIYKTLVVDPIMNFDMGLLPGILF